MSAAWHRLVYFGKKLRLLLRVTTTSSTTMWTMVVVVHHGGITHAHRCRKWDATAQAQGGESKRLSAAALLHVEAAAEPSLDDDVTKRNFHSIS